MKKHIATIYAAEVLYYQQEIVVWLPDEIVDKVYSNDGFWELVEEQLQDATIDWEVSDSDGRCVTDIQLENAKPTDVECSGLPVIEITGEMMADLTQRERESPTRATL